MSLCKGPDSRRIQHEPTALEPGFVVVRYTRTSPLVLVRTTAATTRCRHCGDM